MLYMKMIIIISSSQAPLFGNSMKYITFLLSSALILNQSCDSSSSSSTTPPPAVPGTSPTPSSGGNVVGTTPAIGSETPSSSVPEPIPVPFVIPGNSFQLIAGLSTTRSAFLKDLGEGVSERIVSFADATENLTVAAEAFCGSITPETQAHLKASFRQAMLDWQHLELYQMGPMTEKNSTLKSKIYNWPIVPYLCKIDEEAMYAVEDGEDYVLPTDNNKIGLQALEYLIYENTFETGCPAGLTKTKWSALSKEEKTAARCAYLKPVARDLAANAQVLKTAWGSSSNNYLTRAASSVEGEQGAMQEMFNNILYIDIEMKNKKLGIPAGQDVKGCPGSPAPCVDKQELRYSRLSGEALRANVEVLADLIFGFGEPRRGGLSAILRQENAAAGADKSERNVSDLLTLVETESRSFDDVLLQTNEVCESSQASWVCKVQKSIKTVVADFKAEYASVLKVQVPVEKQGDND